MTELSRRSKILGGLWGAIIGDALGVPVEFTSRAARKEDLVIGMQEYGTHNQPKGTWSDDSSLLLCTVESLLNGFDLNNMGRQFVRWYTKGYWTPWGTIFDIGGATRHAIHRLAKGTDPEEAGDNDEGSNGNGSLMRILPVGLFFVDLPDDELLDYAHRVSSLTHRHPRSQMACGFYCLMPARLLKRLTIEDSYRQAIASSSQHYRALFFSQEIPHFKRLFSGTIGNLPEDEIASDGYVIHTLEASIWCLFNSNSFQDAVLKAVNLGGDTDTTGCVTGGLAGVYYGFEAIPKDWLGAIVREKDIGNLLSQFTGKI